MIKKAKNYIVTLIAAAAFLMPLAVPVIAQAQTPAGPPAPGSTTTPTPGTGGGATVPTTTGDLNTSFCGGTDLSLADSATCDNTKGDGVNSAVKLGLNLFSAIVGIISVVMIIMGGIRYITSGGDSGKVTSAQNTVLYAVIGLVVVALAQIIVKFVLGRFTT